MHEEVFRAKSPPPGLPLEKWLHQLASLRLTQFMIHQTLRLSFFALYGLSDEDYLMDPEVKYNFTDSQSGLP
ncbi:MAG: hypothetical protein M0R70_06380 [Nitrospirae bacterium]|nr:hypothetical protein [Nitrospirota bacterium]